MKIEWLINSPSKYLKLDWWYFKVSINVYQESLLRAYISIKVK